MDTGIRSLRNVFRNGSCSDWPLAMTFSLFFEQADGASLPRVFRPSTHSKEAEGRFQGFTNAYKAMLIIGIEHMDVAHRSKPGHLPFRELPSRRDGARDGDIQRITTCEMCPELSVAHGAYRRMRSS